MKSKVCSLIVLVLAGCAIDGPGDRRYLPADADVALLQSGGYAGHASSEIVFEASVLVLNTFYEGFDNDYLVPADFQVSGPAGSYTVESFDAQDLPAPAAPSSTVFVIDQSGSYADTDPFNTRAQAINKFVHDVVSPNTLLIGASARQGSLSAEPLEVQGVQVTNGSHGDGNYIFELGHRTGGLNAILDGADEALDLLIDNGDPAARKQLVLLVHGNDQSSATSIGSVVLKAQHAGIAIHVIALGPAPDAGFFAQLAEDTGGMFAPCPTEKQMVKVFSELERLINGPRFVYRLRVRFNPSQGQVAPGTEWLFRIGISDEYLERTYNDVPVKINIPA